MHPIESFLDRRTNGFGRMRRLKTQHWENNMAKKHNHTGSNPVPSAGAAPAREKRGTAHAKRSETAIIQAPAETDPASLTDAGREAIAHLAYSYWEQRGCQGGSPEEDWLRAEHEYFHRQASAARA
jgi:hypothetical protein